MLNKEMVHSGETSNSVILSVGKNKFTTNQMHYGYMESHELGSLSRVPYWGNENSYLYELFTDIWEPTGSYSTTFFIFGNSSKSITVTIAQNGNSITKQKGEDKTVVYYNATGFDDFAEQEVELIFDPPYRVSIRKSSRYLPALERRAW